MDLHPVAPADVAALRQAKVDELRVRTLTWRHETLAAAASAYRMREGHAEPGYALFLEAEPPDGALTPRLERCLTEFAVDVPWRGRAVDYFETAVRSLDVRQVVLRSDDGVALEAALGFASKNRWDVRPAGPIYALETGVLRRPARPERSEVKPIPAGEEAAAAPLFAAEPGVDSSLTDGAALARAAREGRLWGLWREQALVGAALVLFHAHHRYAGIRPVIAEEFRRGGLATYLVGEVSQGLLLSNHRLIAEAEPLERAPRRIAEKLGLTLAAHRLLLRSL
jgi:hypothetical protein